MGARVVLSLDGAIVTEVELTKPVTVVGRHPACDICVDHPAISGRHMLFRIVDQHRLRRGPREHQRHEGERHRDLSTRWCTTWT